MIRKKFKQLTECESQAGYQYLRSGQTLLRNLSGWCWFAPGILAARSLRRIELQARDY